MLETIEQQFAASLTTFVAFLPQLAAGLALLLAGWLLARFLRAATRSLAGTFNRLLNRLPRGPALDFVRLPANTAYWLGILVYWVTLLLFATAAIRVMGLTGMANWLERVVLHLPSAIAGAVILIVGFVAASILRRAVTHAAASAGLERAPLFGLIAQAATIVVALVIGLDQLGVDVTFLVLLLGIAVAAILAGFSLAFGLGARELVADLVATHHLKLFLRPGQMADIDGTRGRVLEFTATGVVLETEEGRCLLSSARCMAGKVNVIVAPAKGVEDDRS